MRRPETAGDDAEIRLEPFPERRLELVGPVADDLDPRGLEPQRENLPREERPVQVRTVAADKLGAGDDEDRSGPGQAAGGARVIPFGETSTIDGLPRGKVRRLPFSFTVRFCGAPAMIQRRLAVKSRGLEPGWSVPA